MQNDKKYLYTQPVLDFITISTEYCKYIEQCQGIERKDFRQVMLALLPMLYLKAVMLKNIPEVPGWNEKKLTEEDYNYIRTSVSTIMADKDDFLDVFVEDFKYSETPVLCSISENLADIYQQLRELVETFREGYDEAMQVELFDTIEEFHLQWGQKLLNTLKALHDMSFKNED